ncbi:MAG TPA: GyrI-like domain-containing protein [Actinomycetota bacterium]|nr:GyrI-like domain-containing protein [Actinomycetota bacterium]
MAYEVERKDLEDGYVVTIRMTTSQDQLGAAFQEILPEVDAEILNAGARPAGPAFAIYHRFGPGPDGVELEAGFPVEQPIPTSGRVNGRELPATFAAVAWHHGPYEGLSAAYEAVQAWLTEEGLQASGPPWEVYWTGPMDGVPKEEWRTEVGFPFEE